MASGGTAGARVRESVRPLGLFAVCAVLLCLAWAELETQLGPFWDVVAIVALALAPVLAALASRRWWVGLLVGVVALAPAASLALDVSLTDMRPGARDFFGPVFGALGDGFRDVYETDAPFDRLDHPELAGIVLLGIYAFLATCGLLLACRRALPAGLALVLGVALPVTVAASYGAGNPLTTGALVLAAILLTLFVTRTDRRPLRGVGQAAVLGAVLVFVAVGASTSGAIAKDAFVSWTRWDLYDQPKDPVGVRYVWSSNYRGIAFPDKETVVLTIKGPKRSLYWRATTLDDYTGVGWREDVQAAPAITSPQSPWQVATSADPLLPSDALDRRKWIRQDVTVVALADTHLVAASQPVRWQARSQAPVQYASNGAVLAPRGLRIGTSYTVWSYAPQVSPRALAKLPADYPDSLQRYLEVLPDVTFPAFGTEDRDAAVGGIFQDRSFDVLLGEYRPLYEEAKRVVGNAASPYIAAATLEAYFRTQGGFRYTEEPEQPIDATPPLVDFVLRTKEGYCQHYAGAMAVMLRLLGIPARVAVGFTSGSYDQRGKEWTVTDHDAHAWVEVYFPDHGWLPFDPTPGRGELSAAYSTASTSFPSGGPTALGVNADSLSDILKQRLEGVDPGDARGGDATTPGGATLDGESSGGIGIAGLVLIVLAVLVLGLLALKEVRRRARFLSRDPRRVAAACRRDLVAFLADQRVVVDDSTTLEELAASLGKSYRVDATAFVDAAAAARFAPPEEAVEAAQRARRELRSLLKRLRRTLTASNRARGAFSLRSLPV